MIRRSFNTILAVILIGAFLLQTAFAETTAADVTFAETASETDSETAAETAAETVPAETGGEQPSMEFTIPHETTEPETDENGQPVTTEEPETQAPKPVREPAIIMDEGMLIAGVAILFNRNDLLSRIEPYQTDAEADWDLRESALEGYQNFGISQVGTYLNVRDKASTDGNVIGKMTNNNACDILETSSDGQWYKIKSGSVTGYVSADYILTGTEARDLGKAEATQQVVIKTTTLNVRSEPTEESSIWTQVSGNERYDYVKFVGNWIEIELDSSTGFVSKEYVEVGFGLRTAVKYTPPKEERQATLRDRIVSYAMQYLGGRYVWGGTSLTKGVDCSGFTMRIYQHFGIYLSHYSGSQAYEGKKISRSELKKGDLIFYAKNGTINHVAMYIGDGMVIHARSTRRGICITDMYYRTPVRYVRFINE
ncbi:MAG: C40 family peptidase [Lachnospiraceae bacterium]|nr:C40 family peptidase [Lachnospiraceae bacterium]